MINQTAISYKNEFYDDNISSKCYIECTYLVYHYTGEKSVLHCKKYMPIFLTE